MVTENNNSAFRGAKLMLFIGDKLAVMLRDDFPDISWPDYWDFPGGCREPGETPEQTALRETQEELTIVVAEKDLVWKQAFRKGDREPDWFFAAHLPAERVSEIELGDEGQRWELMSVQDYVEHPKAIPHFVERLEMYMSLRANAA